MVFFGWIKNVFLHIQCGLVNKMVLRGLNTYFLHAQSLVFEVLHNIAITFSVMIMENQNLYNSWTSTQDSQKVIYKTCFTRFPKLKKI